MCEVLIQCVQSFPIKMTYWAAVSSPKGLNKIAVYFYKFKDFSRRKSLIFPGVLQAHANQDT